MNKKEFLEELGNCLLILEDGEQRDILEEYSQHIDMKVESGLSEAEALRDFGSVKELAAEILEAYHVKAEFTEGKGERKGAKERETLTKKVLIFRERIFGCFTRAAGAVRRAAVRCCLTVKRFGKGLAGLVSVPVRGIRNLFSNQTTDGQEQTRRERRGERRQRIWQQSCRPIQEAGSAEAGVRRRSGIRSFGRFIGAFITGCFTWILHLILWCVRCGWNLAMIFLTFFDALFTMCVLFCFGTLIVWLYQGYPLVGVTIGCLGLLLCGSATTILFASLILRRDKTVDTRNMINRKNTKADVLKDKDITDTAVTDREMPIMMTEEVYDA